MDNLKSSDSGETTRQIEADSFEKAEQIKPEAKKVRELERVGGKKKRVEYMNDGTAYQKELFKEEKVARIVKVTEDKDNGEIRQELTLMKVFIDKHGRVHDGEEERINENDERYEKYKLSKDMLDAIVKEINECMRIEAIEDPDERLRAM